MPIECGLALFTFVYSLPCACSSAVQDFEYWALRMGDPPELQANGIYLAGSKFLYVRSDEEVMIGKLGAGGVSIHRCATCCIMGTYNPDMSPAANCKTVGTMADFLRDNGY